MFIVPDADRIDEQILILGWREIDDLSYFVRAVQRIDSKWVRPHIYHSVTP